VRTVSAGVEAPCFDATGDTPSSPITCLANTGSSGVLTWSTATSSHVRRGRAQPVPGVGELLLTCSVFVWTFPHSEALIRVLRGVSVPFMNLID